ncbi:MAG: argininosuccinate synthase [Candidatus Hydrogenedentes bacterium]|nr:argininosuccinate synthase [Candidatus Hydrogenedentota bacterium]
MPNTSVKKVVLAYSGGLDTSVNLRWIKEQYRAEIIAYTADLGQGEELAGLEQKAISTGASKLVVEDLTEEFVRDFVFTAIKANAVYEGTYLMGTSLARPLIAKGQIEVAKREGADAVAHGCTGKGNDQVRFELTYYALKPDIKVIAPWREWTLRSRSDLIEYAEQYDIPVTITKEKPYSCDRNIMHISFEGGVLEDPWAEPPADMFVLTVAPQDAPDVATDIVIGFERGVPVSIDGDRMNAKELLDRLNTLGGQNGIGRVDMVENRFVGMKARGVYETPGATILYIAHRAVESITMDREVMLLRDQLAPKFAQLIYNGFWYSPEMRVLTALIDESQRNVTGSARVRLYKGNCTVLGRKAEKSLYSEEVATFEADKVYRQADAEGFIKLNALRLRMRRILDVDEE